MEHSPIYNNPTIALYGEKGYVHELLQSKENLENELKNKSMRQVAESIGCSYAGVNYAVRRHGIDIKAIRGGVGPRKNSAVEVVKEKTTHPLHKSKTVSLDLLKELYVTQKQPAYKVAETLGMTEKTLRAALNQHEIPRRTVIRHNVPELHDPAFLKRRYEVENATIKEIASEVGVKKDALRGALVRAGVTLRTTDESIRLRGTRRRGEANPNWKGGRKTMATGYIMIASPDHPYKGTGGYVMEHRLVMEKELGRYLETQEIVHHKNGNRQDNRPENLEVTTKKEHYKEHFDAVKKVGGLEEKLAAYEALFGPLDNRP